MDQSARGVKAVFDHALEIDTPAERRAYLDDACAGQPDLRLHVESLLSAFAAAGSFLDQPAAVALDTPVSAATPVPAPAGTVAAEGPGTCLGPYQLVQLIGQGGMGTVWRAEQHHPVRRQVALKVIKPGFASVGVIARFEAERQALALMDHPHIAKVLDAGALPDGSDGTKPGRPYFVMEFVPGVPLTQFCDERRLGLRQRLALFIPVCQAVQHAHQKGIIHRDLKPSNVLVGLYDGKPMPKVIDFGIAKATSAQLSEQTLHTTFGTVVGTLEYMAPEQAELNAFDIDTRADVYSLGVLLYELLTGGTPRRGRLKDVGLLEVLRLIREQEPERPSVRLSAAATAPEVAAARGTEPARLAKSVRGELDWIVLKCLDKDRNRRYETANGLARDLERYLANEPVAAGPPGVGYRLRKFVRRHRGPVLAAAVVLVALLAGIAGTTWGLIRADHARQTAEAQERQAQREKRIADAVRKFQRDLLRQADPTAQADTLRQVGGGFEAESNPTIRELLDRAAAELAPDKIEAKFPEQPEVQASILKTVGETYMGIGAYDQAVAFLGRSRDIHGRVGGPDHPDTLDALHDLATAYLYAGKPTEAIGLFEQVRDVRVRDLGTVHPDTLATLHNLANAYKGAGKYAEAIALFKQVYDAHVQQLGADHSYTLTILTNLGSAYKEAGQPAEAIAVLGPALDAQVRTLGAVHPITLITLNNLATAYQAAGKVAEAIPLLQQVRDAQVQKLGADHPQTLITLNNLGSAYRDTGRTAEAITLLQQTRDTQVKKLGADHPDTLATLHNLAGAYQAAGQTTEAVALFEQVRDARVKKEGAEHPSTLFTLYKLAQAYQAAGQTAKAITAFEQLRDAKAKKLGADHPETLRIVNDLALAHRNAGRLAEAIALFEQLRDVVVKKLGPDDLRTLSILNNLAVTYQWAGQLEQALPLYQQAVTALEKRQFTDRNAGWFVDNLVGCQERLHQYEAAEAWRRKWLAVVKAKDGPQSAAYATALAGLGGNLLLQHQHAEAKAILREALPIAEKQQPDAWTTFQTQALLGGALLGQENYAEAEPLLLAGYEGLKQRQAKIPRGDKKSLAEALDRLVQLYDTWGKPDRANQWRAERAKLTKPAAPPKGK
jgi:serine/threonine protein kinase/lipopolysaccharide biosynthesis regulator YciM